MYNFQMYKILPWSKELDLTEFYAEAKRRGFENNANQAAMVDCFKSEDQWQVWILYFNEQPIGSVAAHSFKEMGLDSYRIAARTCVFTDKLEGPYGKALRTLSVITKHQNPTAQFLIPACIEWAGKNSNLYISSNESFVGSQRLVHNIFFPSLEKTGVFTKVKDMNYRGHVQSIWKLNVDVFYEQLDRYSRWK